MKRSELQRTPFRREPKPPSGPKLVTCRACRVKFTPARPKMIVCGPECAEANSAADKAKQARKAAKAERAITRAKLEKFKSIPTLKAECQVIFNRFIRTRDEGQPCICCGQFATASAYAGAGGAHDACHYRSRGSADHLRYNENNTHLGLKACNRFGHHDYRGGLIQRIGLQAVESLEADQTSVKWTRELLESIKAEYRAKLKALQK